MSYAPCYDYQMGTSQEIFAQRLQQLVGAGRAFESGNSLAIAIKQHQRTINRYIKQESVPTLTALDEISGALGISPVAMIDPAAVGETPTLSAELVEAFAILRSLDSSTLAKATQVLRVLAAPINGEKGLQDEITRNILYKHTVKRNLEDLDPGAETGEINGLKSKRDTSGSR